MSFDKIISEIPYDRDAKVGYLVGIVMDIVCFVYAPLSGDKQLYVLPIFLACIHMFYIMLGIAKYKYKITNPRNLIADLALNILYLWRRTY